MNIFKNMIGVGLGVLLVAGLNTASTHDVAAIVNDVTASVNEVTTAAYSYTTAMPTTRAVFAWEGVDEGDLELLERYSINTLYINNTVFHTIPGFQCYLLAGDNQFTSSDIDGFIDQAVSLDAAGVVIDCEDWDRLPGVLEDVENRPIPLYICIPFWLDTTYGEEYLRRIITSCNGIIVMNYHKGSEAENIKNEVKLCQEYNKPIITAYELQPVGMYGLEECNTYNKQGIQAVEENYKSMFKASEVGLALHSLEWMKRIEK